MIRDAVGIYRGKPREYGGSKPTPIGYVVDRLLPPVTVRVIDLRTSDVHNSA